MKYLILCPLCLIIMAIFVYFETKRKYVIAVILKGLASLVFCIFGYLGGQICADQSFYKAVLIGLILGLIADVLLNLRYVFKNGKPVFLVGILVFLAGHIAYIRALMPYCNNIPLACLAGVILAAVLLKWIFSQIEAAKAFKIFGIFYIGAISIMNCVALTNLISSFSTSAMIFAIGAILFLISDVILILNTFGKKSRLSFRIANITLYYLGQLLIAAALQFVVL